MGRRRAVPLFALAAALFAAALLAAPPAAAAATAAKETASSGAGAKPEAPAAQEAAPAATAAATAPTSGGDAASLPQLLLPHLSDAERMARAMAEAQHEVAARLGEALDQARAVSCSWALG